MSFKELRSYVSLPAFAFISGWCLVMLSLTFSIGTPWETFIHMWRVEFVASLFLAACLVFALAKDKSAVFDNLSRSEILHIILPLFALICWSFLSITWANSSRSALHHSLVWTAYLIFFVFVRSVIDSKRTIRLSVAMLVVCLAFACIPAFWSYLAYQLFGGVLKTGIMFQKSGEQVTALLPIAFLFAVRLKGSKFKYGLIGICSLWLLVLCTLGRINLILFVIGFAVTAVFAWLVYRNPAIRRKIGAVTLAVLLVPAILFVGAKLSSPETATVADRILGNEGTQSSNSFRILMTTLSLEMFRSHPLTGVGGDNFGFELNEYRSAYGSANPNDPNLAHAESEIPERAHNELLQILAELGIVGGIIVGWLLFGVALMAKRSFRNALHSPYRLAAYFGLLIFLASSLVSSYSFRLIQNGFVFFFLLAVCSKYFLRPGETDPPKSAPFPYSRTAAIVTLGACLLLTAYNAMRVSSVLVTRMGDSSIDIDKAAAHYRLAMELDDENPEAPASFGMRLFFEKRFAESVPYLENSIAIGKATSTDFSYLASAYTLAGDRHTAENTMKRAADLYPQSAFVQVRHAMITRANGNVELADEILERARALDRRSANTWVELITNGPASASEKAFREKDSYVPVMDLRPNHAIYAVLDEREIDQPGERRKVGF
jgi:O-antigen ligase